MSSDPFLKQLLSLPTVLSAYLSPDGRWVAFNWYRVHENIDVFLVPADGSAAPIALTHTPEITTFVSWTPDSLAVIVAEDHDGDEHARVFQVDIDHPGDMQPLSDDCPPYFMRGGDLHPDGQTLFYGANYNFTMGQVIDPTWVYRQNLRTGIRIPIARPEKPTWSVPSLNRAGTHLIYPRKDRHPSGRQWHLVDVDGKEDREILNFGDEVKIFARWFPDSQHILVISESTGGQLQEHNSLGIFHWPSGSIRWLVDDSHRSIESAWVSPNGLVVVDEIQQATHSPSFIDPKTGLETHFPGVPGNLLPLGQAAGGDWIAIYYASTNPTDLVRITPQAMQQDRLSCDQLISLTGVWQCTYLEPGRLHAAETFHWLSPDGLRIQGWLYRAQPNPERLIIFIHGGPSSHSEDKINPEIQYFLERGFNVLDVNYRGSTGFGLKFRQSIKQGGWGSLEQTDIAAGAQALIAASLAKPGRVGVTGTSYGGYSVWHLITHYPPEIIAAAAPICGMTDLVVDYETTRPDLRPLSEEMLGGRPDQVPQRYFERSPINFVQHIQGKLLIVQGTRDPNVTPENMHQVRSRLETAGIPYDLLVFEDEGHGIYKPANQEILYTRLVDFFEQAL